MLLSIQRSPDQRNTKRISLPSPLETHAANRSIASRVIRASENGSDGVLSASPVALGDSPRAIVASDDGVTIESTVVSTNFDAIIMPRAPKGLSFRSVLTFFIIAALSWPFR